MNLAGFITTKDSALPIYRSPSFIVAPFSVITFSKTTLSPILVFWSIIQFFNFTPSPI